MSYWNYLAPVLSLLLGSYLLWATYRRANKKQRHLRAFVSLVAVAAMYLLFLNIARDKQTATDNAEELIILTPGSSTDTLKRLLNVKPGLKIYTKEPELAMANRKATLIHQINEIPGLQNNAYLNAPGSTDTSDPRPAIKIIHVLGYGLEENELNLAGNHEIIFHPPFLTRHFNSVNWNRQLYSGEKLRVQGSFNNNKPGDVQIILQGFNTTLDSATIPGDQLARFELQTIPKQNGRAVYTLLVMAGKDTLHKEKVPFETLPTAPIKILMLASSPDFENKFLKNWLFTNNYGVAIRTAVSRNKFNTEYLNIRDIKADRISRSMLNNFDVVIGDATALNKLSAIELNNLKTAVQQDGLGLIIKADSITPASLFFNAPFRYSQSGSLNKQQLHLQTADTGAAMPVLTATRPMFISQAEHLRPLIKDRESHLYSAAAVSGKGILVSTTISNTYNWVLGGDTLAYRGYWSDLISETSRTKNLPQLYTVAPSINATDMPAYIMIESADSLPFRANVNHSLVPMNQQYLLPFQWKGIYWPRKNGWQVIHSDDNQSFYWYSFGKTDWKDLHAVSRIAVNKLRSSMLSSSQLTSDSSTTHGFNSFAKLYIIIMFLICCTYIWIEEKFHNSR
ncbi:hypothetical protein ACX0G7_21410 [Flavitalea antarctica]